MRQRGYFFCVFAYKNPGEHLNSTKKYDKITEASERHSPFYI
jgi:hypothetical protein